jgi:hypothetical protein
MIIDLFFISIAFIYEGIALFLPSPSQGEIDAMSTTITSIQNSWDVASFFLPMNTVLGLLVAGIGIEVMIYLQFSPILWIAKKTRLIG